MLALIICEPWIDMILSGEKTWEIRSKKTNIRGRIGLIKAKSGKIFGYAELIDSIPLTKKRLLENLDKHGMTKEGVRKLFKQGSNYSRPHAWVFGSPQIIKPKKYEHPNGAVIWVRIK